MHGNLQTPQVWWGLGERLESDPKLNVRLEPVNLYETEATDFWGWASVFCDRVSRCEGPHALLGYSLGGRLALHALLACPERWRGALVVGADPGLSDEKARAARLTADEAWAARFLSEDWQTVLADWDAQGVFAGRPAQRDRQSRDSSRERVARLFRIFSKGRQDDLRPALTRLAAPPILYVSGTEDGKYTALGRELAASCPAVKHEIVPDAAHRVPWENLDAFASLVTMFLKNLA